ncbi:Permease of the drug/metabolite transporter (DMT) superfamily, partial [hydrothermal vent metagenome]
MTHYLEDNSPQRTQRAQRKKINLQSLISSLPLLLIPVLYIFTLAQSPVLGDPSEYTFVANILGIAHPPGYAFFTLLGKLVQTIVPIGTIAWRMHLLATVTASLGAWFVFGIIRTVAGDLTGFANLSGLFGAFVVATAVNYWQHAIHANPHILTATFMAANLYFLTRWWAEGEGVNGGRGEWVIKSSSTPSPATAGRHHPFTPSNKWLYAFCLSAGLGITHHPLTVFGFPAYALFIIWVRPSLFKEWRTLLKMIGFGLLGLSVWLYFPIRSPMAPGFGPTTMNTLNGFLDHVLARGLSDSLPFFSLADQPDRARVFFSLLRLQYTLPVIFLALFGLLYPFISPKASPLHPFTRSPITLYALTFLGTYAFVISLRAQDIMAYLIGSFLLV